MLANYDICECRFSCRFPAECQITNSPFITPFSCNECWRFMLCEFCNFNKVCEKSPDFLSSGGDDCG